MESRIAQLARSLVVWALASAGVASVALFGGKPSQKAANAAEAEEVAIYDGGLASGWQDYSWADRNLVDNAMPYSGKPSIRLTPSEYKGLFLHCSPQPADQFKALIFAINGGVQGGQKLSVCLVFEGNQFGKKEDIANFLVARRIPAMRYATARVALSFLEPGRKKIVGVCIQDATGGRQAPVYIADMRLVPKSGAKTPEEITLTVDAGKRLGAINPAIYGLAQPSEAHLEQLKLKLWRWGGNPTTRYNWERGNYWNAARDWEFRNGNYSKTSAADRRPSGVLDQGIELGKKYGSEVYVTIPTLGWVARDDNNATASVGVPSETGEPVAPGSEAIAGYDPTANRKRVSIRSFPRKGKPFADPPDLTDEAVYQDEWVYHLTRKFGKAKDGGVRYYAMDNEPDLWHATHTDMHPVRPDYKEIRDQFLTYARAVKDVDPTAQIGGPVSWGWTGYFFSPRDQGDDKYATHADRKAHGNLPLVAWFLKEVAAHDKKYGKRTLDVLDVHYYPQAPNVFLGWGKDSQTNALRLRSTRGLWDATYSDESWIGTPVQLIPRLRQWVNQYYPGTKIGIMEWNWGADDTLNGGLAVAEVLGIYGRERVDMACYWALPAVGSPGFYAYKIYRNADNRGNGFGDVAVVAKSNAPNLVSCFGSVDSKTGRPIVMAINKSPERSLPVTLQITGGNGVRKAEVYRYSGANLKTIVQIPDIEMQNGRVRLTLPAYSMTLLRSR